MATFPRYDEIQQRSIHNAYFKQEQLIDQLLHHHARTFEFDLHRWFQLGCPYLPPPDWGIYHTIGEAGGNLCRLGEALQLLRVFHDADPTHEVVTIHLELKARSTGEAVGTFDRYSADDLDEKLAAQIGRRNIFTPADLMSANVGAGSLLDAVNRAGNSGGWPTLDKLRGKFIFVVHGESEIDLYATQTNAARRFAFLMRETLWQEDVTVRQGTHVVFHGEVENGRARQLRGRFPGLILRSRQADDESSFLDAQASTCNLILTDQIDVNVSPWAATHTSNLFPFAKAGLRSSDARTDPSVSELQERQQFYVLSTHSADIWNQEDSCSIAHTSQFPPRMNASGFIEDDWSALVGSASNNTIHAWGKAMIMARESLAPGSRYFGVGRAADDHGLFIQWRERDGGETFEEHLGDFGYRIDGQDTHLDAESIHWIRLVVRDLPGNAKQFIGYGSINGRGWREIGQTTMGGDFMLRGLGACSQMSRHPGSPGVEYTFQRLRRNGNLPLDFDVVEVGTADFSKLVLFGERVRRPSVNLVIDNRVDNEVVIASEQRRGETPLCDADDHLFTWSDVQIASSVTYRAEPHDYESPVLEWLVAGSELPRTTRGETTARIGRRTVRIAFEQEHDRQTLTLSSRPEDGAYTVEVQVRAREADGTAAVNSPRTNFTVVGRRTGLDGEYNRYVRGCLRSALLKLKVRPDLILRERPGSPNDPRAALINEDRLSSLVRDISAREPVAARQLRELAREIERSHPG